MPRMDGAEAAEIAERYRLLGAQPPHHLVLGPETLDVRESQLSLADPTQASQGYAALIHQAATRLGKQLGAAGET
jgi:hypothetical protein